MPIGGYAEIADGKLHLRGLVGSPDGKRIIRSRATGAIPSAEQIGSSVAQDLLAKGAKQILDQVYGRG